MLVYDLGLTFEAAVVRVGDDRPEVIGHASIVDWAAADGSAAALELTMVCCRDLLARLGLGHSTVRWVLPVGAGARTPGLDVALDRGLGLPVARLEEPDLAVNHPAAQLGVDHEVGVDNSDAS